MRSGECSGERRSTGRKDEEEAVHGEEEDREEEEDESSGSMSLVFISSPVN